MTYHVPSTAQPSSSMRKHRYVETVSTPLWAGPRPSFGPTVDRCTFKYWAAQAVSKRNHRGAGVSRGRKGDFKTVLHALSIVLLSTLNINEPLLIDLNSS